MEKVLHLNVYAASFGVTVSTVLQKTLAQVFLYSEWSLISVKNKRERAAKCMRRARLGGHAPHREHRKLD